MPPYRPLLITYNLAALPRWNGSQCDDPFVDTRLGNRIAKWCGLADASELSTIFRTKYLVPNGLTVLRRAEQLLAMGLLRDVAHKERFILVGESTWHAFAWLLKLDDQRPEDSAYKYFYRKYNDRWIHPAYCPIPSPELSSTELAANTKRAKAFFEKTVKSYR